MDQQDTMKHGTVRDHDAGGADHVRNTGCCLDGNRLLSVSFFLVILKNRRNPTSCMVHWSIGRRSSLIGRLSRFKSNLLRLLLERIDWGQILYATINNSKGIFSWVVVGFVHLIPSFHCSSQKRRRTHHRRHRHRRQH